MTAENSSRQPAPLRSVHTSNFPLLLESLRISLLVTTYQAGKLVLLRPDQGVLNTHFRSFHSPMGLAVDGDRLAIGTPGQIGLFRNVPAVGRTLQPPGKYDACFLPRSWHVTGDIQIHEMAWGQETGVMGQESGVRTQASFLTPDSCLLTPELLTPDSWLLTPELWFVATRFSCLATLDADHSFVPRWRPPFVTGLAPEDRCHLNGLCLVEGRPGYVTALGATDAPAGWRANKRDGGVLLEVPSGRVVTSGLSMPHSPRWYDGRLWLLESGKGGFGVVDPRTGRYECLVELPGFTRGLDFCGPLAFIGLSQVRETAVFSGIPITERPRDRKSGIWVVNWQSGEVIAFVKFEDALQEIFAVQVLPGVCFPELINDDDALLLNSFELPDKALREIPAAVLAGQESQLLPETTRGR